MIKTYFIAEAGLNHNGNIKIAKKMIDVAIEAKADAIKFQKRDVNQMATENILNEPFNKFPSLGNTYRKVRGILELNKKEYKELSSYCKNRIDFIVTPFDIQSLEFLDDIRIDALKIASHSLTDIPLLEEVSKRNKLIYLSTGMSFYKDIDASVDIFKNNDLVILHCISQYPCEYKYTNLTMIQKLKQRYPKYKIGYSDHEDGIVIAPVAISLGAEVIEKHFTLDKDMEGFDHKFSLNPAQLNQCIMNIRNTEFALIEREKALMENEMDCFNNYRRSIVSEVFIKKGTTITRDMLTTKAPNKGLSPSMIPYVVGKKAKNDIMKDSHITSIMIV